MRREDRGRDVVAGSLTSVPMLFFHSSITLLLSSSCLSQQGLSEMQHQASSMALHAADITQVGAVLYLQASSTNTTKRANSPCRPVFVDDPHRNLGLAGARHNMPAGNRYL